MSNPIDKAFVGPLSAVYAEHLVPLIFEPYAVDLVNRLTARPRPITRLLEVAAGTGVVTRELASRLPGRVEIVATDLNAAMLEQAAKTGTSRVVEWQKADAMQLPFPNESFDAVVCQFGVMFFPDKAKAFAETRRVLKPGGVFIFSVWDRMEENDFGRLAHLEQESLFPADPPRFLARVVFGHHDREVLTRALADGGFTAAPQVDTIAARSRASSPRIAAFAWCQGTPLRGEIEARDASRLEEATDAVAASIAKHFGSGAVDGKIQAVVFTVEK
jgi:ubiquinone/menaquinone biosynthesis C-methylase UbiE